MNRRQFLRLMAAGGIAAAAPISYGMEGPDPSGIEVVHSRIEQPFFPTDFDGLKIAFLSDLHYGSIGVTPRLIETAFERALQARPDVMCLGGDLVTGDPAGLKEVLAMLRGVSVPLGMFAVLGNHEFRWNVATRSNADFDKSPVHLLRNETVFLRRGKSNLPLIGLDNFFNQPYKTVRHLLPEIESRPCLLLEHSPDLAEMLTDRFTGLMLAGHTHGGQVVLPGIGRMMSASRFGLKYVAGAYPAGGGRMYITRGIGTVLVPFRVGCPPEVSILEVTAGRPMQT